MKNDELMDLLGKAFSDGEVDALAEYLAPDCEYESEYAETTVNTSEKILSRMKKVFSCCTDESRYSFKRISIAELFKEGRPRSLDDTSDTYLNEYGLLLYHFDIENPCAVVSAMRDRKTGLIKRILLSRNPKVYNISFSEKESGKDSPYDLPSTVVPMTPHDNILTISRRRFLGNVLFGKSR